MSDRYADMPHPIKDFTGYLSQGKFMLQRSRESGNYIFHPRVAEPLTGCTDLEWVEASGMGTVYSTTTIRVKPPAADYNLALIDLAEGPRMMSRVDDVAPDAVTIGMKVKARIVEEDGKPLVVFSPI